MHPMRLITYAILISVVTLMAMGGIGFYVGYSAGRGDMEELKTLIAAGGSEESAAAIAEILKNQSGGETASAPQVDLGPVLDEIRSINTQLGKLEERAAEQPLGSSGSLDQANADPAVQQELTRVKSLLAESNQEYQTCQQNLTSLQTRFEELKTGAQQVSLPNGSGQRNDAGSVVLFDNVLLSRNTNKLYQDVDVALSLRSVASRSARIAVNQQTLGISFGQRKIFQHRDVTCELVLMETDLEGSKARFSIACKR